MEPSFVSVGAARARGPRRGGPESTPRRRLGRLRAGYACAAVDHRFSGPNYTIGIEEELMILDAESLELVNAIESLLEAAPSEQVKPELMESVLEIATTPQRNAAE